MSVLARRAGDRAAERRSREARAAQRGTAEPVTPGHASVLGALAASRGRRGSRSLACRPVTLPAWTLTAALGVVYVIVAPPSSDLAAAGYRSELFSRVGLTLWDNGWYGGHHLLGYSLLAPGLGALLGLQLLGALSMIAAAALFAALLKGRGPARATRLAAWWFALGAGVTLLANRIPFDLGLALGLASLVVAASSSKPALGRVRAATALALALACALASPVAGAFLALAALAWALGRATGDSGASASGSSPSPTHAAPGSSGSASTRAGLSRRLRVALLSLPAALALAALAPIALLAIAFPEGGSQPFVASAFYPALAAVLALAAAIPARRRALRVGALLYALALVGAYAIPTPVGGNADRLGALVAGPVLAVALVGRATRWRAATLVVLAPLLLYWQLKAPLADVVSAASDRGVDASYYAPLVAELRRLGVGYEARPARVEVVPTRNHAEARWVAGHVAIARGWERQLDVADDALFYAGTARPTAARYGRWLHEQAVSYVALADAPLDYSARAEARIVRAVPGYLRERWRSAHWRLFEVRSPTPLAQPPSVLTQLHSDSFMLRASRPGTFLVRVRFTPYWALATGHGCVRRAPDGWTEVQPRAAGQTRVAIDFSLARVFGHGPRCR